MSGSKGRPKRPRAIIFDLWYTLISPEDFRDPGFHTSAGIPQVLGLEPAAFLKFWDAQASRRYREPRPMVEYVRDYLAGLGRKLSAEEATDLDAVWASHDQALTSPRPQVLAALAGLVSDGFRLGLLSNAHEREMRHWSTSPLAEYFEAVCLSCEIGRVKPAPEAYAMVLAELGLRPEEVVFVGDGASSELAGARAAGIGRVVFMRDLIAELGVDAQRLEDLTAQADAVIDDIQDLRELLSKEAEAG